MSPNQMHANATVTNPEAPGAAGPGRSMAGLGVKSILVLTLLVLAVTIVGGGWYYSSFRTSLRQRDKRELLQTAGALKMASAGMLAGRDRRRLAGLVRQAASQDGVRYVAVVDANGVVISSAGDGADDVVGRSVAALPVSAVRTAGLDGDRLLHAQPILARDAKSHPDTAILGAVRVVVDTSRTAANLAHVQRRMAGIGAGICLLAIPLGYFLIWRLVVEPTRQLVDAVRRLGSGDLSARVKVRRNDEFGELAAAFDEMARQVQMSSEQLERLVAERTSELAGSNYRLQEEIAEKEQFLRAVSHDLNAPLRNVAGLAALVMAKHRSQLPEDVIARLGRIQVNVDAAGDMISELLELSRIRRRPHRRQDVDIADLVDDVARCLEYDLAAKGIELTVSRPMPTMCIEKGRVRQVFQNLIDNAIKYMSRPSGGKIEVGAEHVDGQWRIHVRDNGPGIRRQDQEEVFGVFRRAQDAAVAKIQGKGVGLAVVKQVVANHDGRVWLESEPGKGATFFFTLDSVDHADNPDSRLAYCASGQGAA